MSKTKEKKKKGQKAYNQKGLRLKKEKIKMLRWTESNSINKKSSKTVKIKKSLRSSPPSLQAPPDIETITDNMIKFTK